MDINSEQFVRQLIDVLEREIKLYTKYTALVEEEKEALVKFKEEKVTAITADRVDIYNQLVEAQQIRQELTTSFPNYRGVKLYDLIIKHMQPKQAKRILPLVLQLRETVKHSRDVSSQHSKTVSFTLRSLQGVISILRSATQTVIQSYNCRGREQKSYHPACGSREQGVLGKA